MFISLNSLLPSVFNFKNVFFFQENQYADWLAASRLAAKGNFVSSGKQKTAVFSSFSVFLLIIKLNMELNYS